MLTVCLPGTGGVLPLEYRWLTCCWMEYQGRAILIDCGEGTQIALKKAGCKLGRLDTLLITHFHADHIAGLPGLLLTLGNNGKTSPLTIVGPAGLGWVVSSLTVIAPVLPYQIRIVEIEGKEQIDGWDGLSIASLPLAHSMPCYGYRIRIERKPVFSPQKAQHLGVPCQMYHTLHSGKPVTLDDGRMIHPEQVLDGVRSPIVLCYCTDTQPVDEMVDFVRNADLFIGEGMYGDDAMREKTEAKGHMLFSESAHTAKLAGAKRLWLTHYSPAMTQPEEFLSFAKAVFPDAVAAYDGIRMTLTGEPPAANSTV